MAVVLRERRSGRLWCRCFNIESGENRDDCLAIDRHMSALPVPVLRSNTERLGQVAESWIQFGHGANPGRCQMSYPPGTNRYMISHATGAATSSESSRSMTPPCPGRNELMSLIPKSLLIIDSMRSPQVPTATRLTPRMMPTQNGTFRARTAIQMPAAVPKISDPATPSQDFFGLIVGAIGCLPNS